MIWAALVVDVLRQQWISRGAKIAWIVFIILVPVVSWITYGIVRHRCVGRPWLLWPGTPLEIACLRRELPRLPKTGRVIAESQRLCTGRTSSVGTHPTGLTAV